jgi:hypothetical protein
MEIADQFQEIGFLLHKDGLVAVLKEVAASPIPAIEGAGITGQDPAHDRGERARASPDQ